MGTSGWSNDQLNAIYIYSATTGNPLLTVDENGIFYASSDANGSYFLVETDDDNGNVKISMQPPDSADPSVTYLRPGTILGTEQVRIGQGYSPIMQMASPTITEDETERAVVALFGKSSNVGFNNSLIYFSSYDMFCDLGGAVGLGTLSYSYTPFTGNFNTTSDTGIFALGGPTLSMIVDRIYESNWMFTLQSTVAGDRIGLRLYSSTTTSLTGATLMSDFGTVVMDVAATPQPVRLDWAFIGLPGKYIILAARRVSGSGTCSLTTKFLKLADLVHS